MKLSINEKQRLKHKYGEWALISGASSGIGLELAKQLAEAGLNLIIHSRHQQKLEMFAVELRKINNIDVKIISSDLSEPAGVETLIQACRDIKIGMAVLSAGFGTSGKFIENTIASEVNLLKVNVESVLTLTHYFSVLFANQKRGGIILLSSMVAFQGTPYSSNYASSKAFVQSLAEGLAVELKPYGVDVLAAAPGPVKTGFGTRANIKMQIAMNPEQVGVPILKALGRQTTVFPGILSKLFVYSLRTVPRWAKIKIVGKVMKEMTKHQTKMQTQ